MAKRTLPIKPLPNKPPDLPRPVTPADEEIWNDLHTNGPHPKLRYDDHAFYKANIQQVPGSVSPPDHRPFEWWCYPKPTPSDETFFQRTHRFRKLRLRGFPTRDEAKGFLSDARNSADYVGPVPLLMPSLNPADPKPIFDDYLPVERIGQRPQSDYSKDQSQRARAGIDPLSITCVCSDDFRWRRIINEAMRAPGHQFAGDKIDNPKIVLRNVACEFLGAVRTEHPDLSLDCFRGVVRSWEHFEHLYDSCCWMLGSDPSLAWETVNNALLYVWKKLDQFATWTPGAKERFPSARQCEAAAKKVEAHLASTGMGQLKFGKQAGTSERTIRKILTREAVSRATYEGVADAMGLSFDNLLDS